MRLDEPNVDFAVVQFDSKNISRPATRTRRTRCTESMYRLRICAHFCVLAACACARTHLCHVTFLNYIPFIKVLFFMPCTACIFTYLMLLRQARCVANCALQRGPVCAHAYAKHIANTLRTERPGNREREISHSREQVWHIPRPHCHLLATEAASSAHISMGNKVRSLTIAVVVHRSAGLVCCLCLFNLPAIAQQDTV